MTLKLGLNRRILITVLATFLVWGHIAWDYFHGGIPTHYLFHSKDMPGIPNWIGGLVLPFFTYFLLYRIHKRIDRPNCKEKLQQVVLSFLASALVAISIAICFMNEIDIIDYIMGSLFILAFFKPLYKAEYLLGWVLGSSFTFGAIIPIAFGSLFCLFLFIFYKVGIGVGGLVKPKFK
ncbi:hypothetical protein ACFSQJ_08550 [Croceitalea marina]|uniref:Uncharacterized protein n=1 Tax=Croceitalea marina TaxID=1775166 RepID=A0ABW5MW63_9FLAO